MVTLFGIKSCDSCRRARKWLADNDVAFAFHDVRADGLDKERLQSWFRSASWSRLLNTRSRTWRGIDDAEKEGLDADRALSLLLQHPTLLKRPILESGGHLLVGFSTGEYASELLS